MLVVIVFDLCDFVVYLLCVGLLMCVMVDMYDCNGYVFDSELLMFVVSMCVYDGVVSDVEVVVVVIICEN